MKKTIIDFRWVFFICAFILITLLGVFTLSDELWISLAVIFVGAFLIFGYAFVFPNSYTFSNDGITVRYLFCLKTFLRWNDIKHIEDHYSGGKVFPWWRVYKIGYFDTKIIFHEIASLPKNKEITRQIEEHYHKNIEIYG